MKESRSILSHWWHAVLLDSVANYQHRIIWAIVFKIEGPALEISEPFFFILESGRTFASMPSSCA